MAITTLNIFLPLLSFLSLFPILTAQQHPDYSNATCFDDKGTYSNRSAYHTNLNTLLSNFTTNTETDYGFYNFSHGQNPDTVYASGLCRGDVQPDVCRSCLKNATNLLPQQCPNQKEAFLYYDLCIFQYSSRSMFRIYQDPDFFQAINNQENAADADQYTDALNRLMEALKTRAAGGGPNRKVAAGNASFSFQTVYGLAQCTPDLSEQDCDECLVKAISDIPLCCQNKVGGRVFKRNCNLRFEKVRFYDPTVIDPIQLPPPPSASPSTNTSSSQGPPGPPNVPTGEGKNKRSRIAIIIVAVVTGAFIALLILTLVYLCVRKSKKTIENEAEIIIKDDEEIRPAESLQFDFETIRLATDNFSIANKLGQGGFGPVYKGKLRNGQEVAVKRLSMDSGQGYLEFKNEVLLMAKLQHRNLVRLLGFCLDGTERLLVYEFLPNRSLDYMLFDPIQRTHLHWEVRYKIIVGIARGILYLHDDSRLRIIHRDLKASNILLDKELNPKIADFGMARLFDLDQTQSNTSRIVGTYGYMAPEYAMQGQISTKSDVFSFGILVLEIISGQKNSSVIDEENIQDLLSFVWKNWREGTVSNIVNPVMSNGSRDEIMRSIHIALLCVQENAVERPTMASVELMLNSYSLSLPSPSRPPCLMNYSSTVEIMQSSNKGEQVLNSTQEA
ncbi:cysteine-rich receptor-like protein kinase 29 [Prosopis cineraria]|uniref:cysteine-rich receptor-like protein kinase 29 n=1 Tax=Prosopis cineraria TaxID=364024 RepID=UPI0024107BFA|nr:cysteine-rich receptor-like protein kinase 29 [Prosopis cineraria]